MMLITVVLRHFTSYKYSICLVLIAISYSFTFCLGFSSLLSTTMEDKRRIKRSRSSVRDSSSSSSDASTSLPSPSDSVLSPVLLPEASLHRPPSPVHEHGGPSEAIPVVDLSFDEEEIFPDNMWDEELARRLFGELNHKLRGPPGDDNIIILNDSDEEDEVHEEITTDVEAFYRELPSPIRLHRQRQ
jgi:hypothetical protein